jgi:hypothetical protein
MKSFLPSARIALAGVLVVTAVFIPRRVRALEDYTAPRNAEVDARGARTIRIEAAAGFLKVEGRKDLDQVRIKGTARASRRGWLDEIKLVAERRGDEVYIKADIPDRDQGFYDSMRGDWERSLDLTIEVPSSLALDVEDGSGEAEFNNAGALRFEDGSGEISVKNARGNVRITDGSGSIIVDGVEGSVRIDDGSGEIRVRNVTGDFTIGSDGSGEINASNVSGTLRVESDGSGSIDVDRIGGDFIVERDGSGDIHYETVKGRVEIPERYRYRRGRS